MAIERSGNARDTRPKAGREPVVTALCLSQLGCDGDRNHYRANDNHRSDDFWRCQDAEPYPQDSCICLGDSASTGDIPKTDPVMVESVKTPSDENTVSGMQARTNMGRPSPGGDHGVRPIWPEYARMLDLLSCLRKLLHGV